MRFDANEQMCGAYMAAYTPVKPDGLTVDYEKYREHIRFLLSSGIREGQGLIMGTGGSGEGYLLTDQQYFTMTSILAEECRGKIPTMAGVFDRGLPGAIEKIKFAEDAGIDFIQLSPPHSQGATDEENYTFFKMIDDATSKIGIILYHTHWDFGSYHPWYQIGVPLLEKITDLESVVGLKWHAKTVELFTQVLAQFNEKVVIVDNAGWVTSMRQNTFNVRMFMAPTANWDPPIIVTLAELWNAGDWEGFAAANKVAAAPKWAVHEAQREELYGSAPTKARLTPGDESLVYSLGEGTLNHALMDIMGRPFGPALHPQYQLSEAGKERAKQILSATDTEEILDVTF